MGYNIIIVERSNMFTKPDYCIHGETFCVRCERACWLGDKSIEIVKGGILPLCLNCALEMREIGEFPNVEPTLNAADHRRSEGPH